MIVCTCLTFVLPESINHRKTTLREYVQSEHDRLEAQSIELVNLKAKEQSNDAVEEKVEVMPHQQSQLSSVGVWFCLLLQLFHIFQCSHSFRLE